MTYGQYHPALIDTFRIGAKIYHYSGDLQGRNLYCSKALTILDDFERSSSDWKFKKEYLEELKESGQEGPLLMRKPITSMFLTQVRYMLRW